MNDPLISIVIANYNYGRYLESAIKSIVEQADFAKCELIVVDGGSTDNSVEIIRKYSDKITWWCSEKDGGQSAAFNKGFSHAKGQLGCWVNADDILLPGALRAVIEHSMKYPRCEWIGGGVVWLNKDLTIKKCSFNTQIPKSLQAICPGFIVGGPSSFFSVKALRELGGFDERLHYAMDNDLWLRMLNCGMKLDILPRYIWTFREHESSKTTMNLTAHDVSKLPKERLLDREKLEERYPTNLRYEKFTSRFISLFKLMNGTYLRSFLDTKRHQGQLVMEVFT